MDGGEEVVVIKANLGATTLAPGRGPIRWFEGAHEAITLEELAEARPSSRQTLAQPLAAVDGGVALLSASSWPGIAQCLELARLRSADLGLTCWWRSDPARGSDSNGRGSDLGARQGARLRPRLEDALLLGGGATYHVRWNLNVQPRGRAPRVPRQGGRHEAPQGEAFEATTSNRCLEDATIQGHNVAPRAEGRRLPSSRRRVELEGGDLRYCLGLKGGGLALPSSRYYPNWRGAPPQLEAPWAEGGASPSPRLGLELKEGDLSFSSRPCLALEGCELPTGILVIPSQPDLILLLTKSFA
ncbi:hypothetical protein Salat_0238500 [Sesamum alatum]|uniref:Uncharacterized protein n=1 Tax=Sesamum alatum TaxID=300844 RepID=A0AAE2CYD6_9LAMI|nr:hypothetical protein Salat_0238500 [Sesamum alatum]